MKSIIFLFLLLFGCLGATANTNAVVLWSHPLPAPTPSACEIASNTPYHFAGEGWTFRHHPTRFGVFVFSAGDHTVEHVPDEPIVLMTSAGGISTLCTTQAEMNVRTPSRIHNRLETTIHLVDANGRTWTIRRTFRPENESRELLICTDVTYDPHHDDPNAARVLHVPYLTLLANRTSAGHKHQALLAGVEYLGDENSSSARDIATPEHDRRIPAEFRIATPLAVLTSKSHWISAQWMPYDPTRPERFATVFDTPDRVYHSGGHLLAFWCPAVGSARQESSFSITKPVHFRQGRHTIRLRAGAGGFVTDALNSVLVPADLPDTLPLPATNTLAKLADEGRNIIRHNHSRTIATQLLLSTNFTATLEKLFRTNQAFGSVPPADRLFRTNQAFVTTSPADRSVRTNQAISSTSPASRLFRTNQAIARDPLDLSLPGTPSTCGELARQLLESTKIATWSGDEAYISRVLSALDRVTVLSRGNVPRGGHPGIIPIHAPNLQAATDLADCYTAAYLLRPRESYLRDARRWATAGLAFIRLTGTVPTTEAGSVPASPTGSVPIGAYTATAALGATINMGTGPGHLGTGPGHLGTDPSSLGTGPCWIGHPRTAEALAYALVLPRLARIEPTRRWTGYWRIIAKGITHTAIRQLYPADDAIYAGLLPTAWNLLRQTREGTPRDPFAVQELAAELNGQPFSSCRAIPMNPQKPSLLHLPGSVSPARKVQGSFTCKITCWPETFCRVVVTRTDRPLAVTFNGQPIDGEYLAERRLLVITLPPRASGTLAIRPAQASSN